VASRSRSSHKDRRDGLFGRGCTRSCADWRVDLQCDDAHSFMHRISKILGTVKTFCHQKKCCALEALLHDERAYNLKGTFHHNSVQNIRSTNLGYIRRPSACINGQRGCVELTLQPPQFRQSRSCRDPLWRRIILRAQGRCAASVVCGVVRLFSQHRG
jgi:hypothetical protein